jgi:hypothetical protein
MLNGRGLHAARLSLPGKKHRGSEITPGVWEDNKLVRTDGWEGRDYFCISPP